jgi:hypothetical protein
MKAFDIRWVLNVFSSGDSHDPETKGKLVCQTSFSPGEEVVETRRDKDGIITVRQKESTDWNKPIEVDVYSNLDSLEPAVGNEVLCIFGRGRIIEIRPLEQQVAIRLSSWRLAGDSWVTCYLSTSAVKVVCDKKVYEMTVDEKVLYAQAIKEEASREFAEKDYDAALRTYARAVDNMRYVHEAPNPHRKVLLDVVLLTIACSNNAGTCCMMLEKWDEAARFARNALVLIESLEPKKHKKHRKRMVHAILSKSGYTDSKIFGEWRVRSLLTMASAFTRNEKYEEALSIIKEARDVITMYSAEEYAEQPALAGSIKILHANEKQAKGLKKVCKDCLKANLNEEQNQQPQELYNSPPRRNRNNTFSEEKKEESDPHLINLSPETTPSHLIIISPETTRVLNRALGCLAPFPFLDIEEESGLGAPPLYLPSSAPVGPTKVMLANTGTSRDDEAGRMKAVAPLGGVADEESSTGYWWDDSRTLTGIVVVTTGIGLTAMALNSISRRQK